MAEAFSSKYCFWVT